MSKLWEPPVARVSIMSRRPAGDGNTHATLFKNTWNSSVIWQDDYSIYQRGPVELSRKTHDNIQAHTHTSNTLNHANTQAHTHISRDDSFQCTFPVLIEKERQHITAHFIFWQSRKHITLSLKLRTTSFVWNCNFLKKPLFYWFVFLKWHYRSNAAAENLLQVLFSDQKYQKLFSKGKKVSSGISFFPLYSPA